MAAIKLNRKSTPALNLQGGGLSVVSGVLAASITANATKSDHAVIDGYVSKIAVVARNKNANSVVFGLEACFDPDQDAWKALQYRETPSASYASTDKTLTADSQAFLFLSPIDTPRCIRVSVTTANANGTRFDIYAER